jgi:hypothetical protein
MIDITQGANTAMLGSRLPMFALKTLLLLVCSQVGVADPMQTHSAYEAARSQITRTYDQQRAACNALGDSPMKLCVTEAQATANRSRAEAAVNYLGTNRSRINSQLVNIRADFSVAQAGCATQSAIAQSECINLARDKRDRLLSDVRAAKQASALARKEGAGAPVAAPETANLSQCDALLGTERDACTATVLPSLGQ